MLPLFIKRLVQSNVKLLKRLGICGLILLAPALAKAESRVFTLNCHSEKFWPSGVPATFTSYENLQDFRRWCDAEEAAELKVEMQHRPDYRTGDAQSKSYKTEGMLTFDGDDYNSVADALVALPSVKPQFYYQYLATQYSTGASAVSTWVYEYVSDTTWNATTKVIIENDGETTVLEDTGPHDSSNPAAFCHLGSFYSSPEQQMIVRCAYRSTQKMVRKKACAPHHHYTFINLNSFETTNFFRDGGSCYESRPPRYVDPVGAPE